MKLRHLVPVVPLLALAVLAAACGSSAADDAEPGEVQTQSAAATSDSTPSDASDSANDAAGTESDRRQTAADLASEPDFDRASEPEALALIERARQDCGGFMGAVEGHVSVSLDLSELGEVGGGSGFSISIPFAVDADGDTEVVVSSDALATPDGSYNDDDWSYTVRWVDGGDYFIQPSEDELVEEGHPPGTWFTEPEGMAQFSSAPLELREGFCGDDSGVFAQLTGAIVGGTETIRNTPTKRVDGFVPLNTLAAEQSADEADDDDLDLLGAFLSAGGGAPLNVSVWLDDDGNVHRWTFTHSNLADMLVSMLSDTDDASLDINVTVELWNFGAVADLVAPPPEQVVDTPTDGRFAQV